MKIRHLRIENFRNIRLAEISNPPDFMVICGGNGSGKSAILNAIMTAKEHAGSYDSFQFDPRVVSADATAATISMTFEFSAQERAWIKATHKQDCPTTDVVEIGIKKNGEGEVKKRSVQTHHLLRSYESNRDHVGFFDFIGAHRIHQRKSLSGWDANSLSDHSIRNTLGAEDTRKFQFTKEFLASLVMKDMQHIQRTSQAGKTEVIDSLEPIRKFFNDFFAPLEFLGVDIHTSPFRYRIKTPRGEIDIDDLSSGEKEILNTFVRFHQLQPKDAIILFDEADAHLHPDLERRYLRVLKQIGEGNQLWLTTHSPEMMIAAEASSLFAVLREPTTSGANQLVKVSDSQLLHDTLAEVMGSRGIVSFNQRIVFIEGEESSADREVYEKFYPPSILNVSFVPAGNSATVRKTAERVNELLSSGGTFQFYYSIVDRDIDRALPAPAGGRLFVLPVYHVENFLLDEEAILAATHGLLGSKCPYKSSAEVRTDLIAMVVSDQHLKPLAAAILDASVAKLAQEAWDAVYKGAKVAAAPRPDFAAAYASAEALMKASIADDTWKARCKGRDLLKCYASKHGINYVQLRNLVLSFFKVPPAALETIMKKILS